MLIQLDGILEGKDLNTSSMAIYYQKCSTMNAASDR